MAAAGRGGGFVLAAALIGVAAAGTAAAAYLLSKSATGSFQLTGNGGSGPVNVAYDGSLDLAVQGGTPDGALTIYWSLSPSQSDPSFGVANVPCAQGVFDSNGAYACNLSQLVPPQASGQLYITVLDHTSQSYSNWLEAVIAGTAGSCVAPDFACYANGACCPPGDVCANSSGVCPSGYVSDPSAPGCCVASAPYQAVPSKWVGVFSIDAAGTYCQPIVANLFSWSCCGTPKTARPSVSWTVQVLDQHGNPMSGATVAYTLNPVNNLALLPDQSSYQTDQYGKIYPVITVDWVPTWCDPSYNGTQYAAIQSIQFWVLGYPPGSGAVTATLDIKPVLQTTMATACNGFCCGSCP